MTIEESQDRPCSNCGASEYTWGLVREQAAPVFAPFEDRPLLDRIFESHVRKVQARLCNNCGNIQLFARQSE
jgi:ribosomal protein S27AE